MDYYLSETAGWQQDAAGGVPPSPAAQASPDFWGGLQSVALETLKFGLPKWIDAELVQSYGPANGPVTGQDHTGRPYLQGQPTLTRAAPIDPMMTWLLIGGAVLLLLFVLKD